MRVFCPLTYCHARNSVLSPNTESLDFVFPGQHQIESTAFLAVPFVQLGDHLHHPARHDIETPCSTAGNGVAALKRDHIMMPVGTFPAGRRFCSLDRYDLVKSSHCFELYFYAPDGKDRSGRYYCPYISQLCSLLGGLVIFYYT